MMFTEYLLLLFFLLCPTISYSKGVWNGYRCAFSFTTDDGYKCNLDWKTIFDRFGYHFTIFVCPLRGGLNVRDLNTLHKGGHEIASHSMTHRLLIKNIAFIVKYIGKASASYIKILNDTLYLWSTNDENYKIALTDSSYKYLVDLADYINSLPSYNCSLNHYPNRNEFCKTQYLIETENQDIKNKIYQIIEKQISRKEFFCEICEFQKWLYPNSEEFCRGISMKSMDIKRRLYQILTKREEEMKRLFYVMRELRELLDPKSSELIEVVEWEDIKNNAYPVRTTQGSDINELLYEVCDSKKWLEEVIYDTSYKCNTFAYPWDEYSDRELIIVRDSAKYIGARGGGGEKNTWESINLYQVSISLGTNILCGNNLFTEQETRAVIRNLITKWKEERAWVVVCAHTTDDIDTLHLAWILDELQKDGEVWVERFDKIAKYIRATHYTEDGWNWKPKDVY